MMETGGNWQCTDKKWRADVSVAWLKFDAEDWEESETPRYFFTRIARFGSVSLSAIDADGSVRSQHYTEEDGTPFAGGPVFQLELPEITLETRIVLARIERPHSVPLLTEARLSTSSENSDWSQLDVMLLAVVIGMLILPLLFDISFFAVLRERFVLLHAALVVTMMVYVLLAGGLISVFVTLPVAFIAIGAPLAWAVGSALAAFFLADFLEEGAQSRVMKRLLVATAAFTFLVPGICAFQFSWMHPFDDKVYFYAFIPSIVVYTLAVILAVKNGSRSGRFVAFAWAPIMLAAIERLLRGLGVYAGPSTLDQMLYIATGLEVILMSLAVADRFLALKRERDEAVAEAEMLERLSERDHLTGLLNRRAVAVRFEKLHAAGFHTFALVDLDHFKAINDQFGHKVGDDVLVALGDVLCGDEERTMIGVRMGGEEFVVLLRGRNALQRAEAIRQSIPRKIATAIPGLDRPVTASMGVIVVPKMGGNVTDFADLYARADAMMYEAKESGRNRMCYEKLTVFNQAPPQRRQLRSAA
ncbi:MAG: diguanylate cyclase [Pseudomonadota bacterium]